MSGHMTMLSGHMTSLYGYPVTWPYFTMMFMGIRSHDHDYDVYGHPIFHYLIIMGVRSHDHVSL